MDVAQRFTETVAVAPHEIRLDVAAYCIAAAAHPGLDIDRACTRLDELAAECPTPTFEGVREYLFVDRGFAGNVDDYGDPENSFLDSVVERRVGIPITLSVLMMEVARRLNVDAHGVGMPGHFLVGDGARDATWCDPFHSGALCGIDDCREIFRRVHGSVAQFTPALLQPTPPVAILTRMLANLEHGRLATDPTQLAWMCDLHLALPGLSDADRARVQAAARTVRARWN